MNGLGLGNIIPILSGAQEDITFPAGVKSTSYLLSARSFRQAVKTLKLVEALEYFYLSLRTPVMRSLMRFRYGLFVVM